MKCPICGGTLYFNFDEWGHTPFHLHCEGEETHSLNIGATSKDKCLELFDKYSAEYRDMAIEFWHNKIQYICLTSRRDEYEETS